MPDDKLPTPDRVLVVAAHPDDIEFGAAGTVARWVAEGAVVRYLIVTRGDKGSDDPQADIGALTRLRETEQRAAAAELGVDGVDFLDEPAVAQHPELERDGGVGHDREEHAHENGEAHRHAQFPQIAVGTAEAYRGVRPRAIDFDLAQFLLENPIEE